MKYYLSEDVISGKYEVYGHKGDEVTLVSKIEEHINVAVVEGKNGNRFPVNVNTLSEQKINPNPVQSNPEPVKQGRKKKEEHTKLF
jgi:hypothetical protein